MKANINTNTKHPKQKLMEPTKTNNDYTRPLSNDDTWVKRIQEGGKMQCGIFNLNFFAQLYNYVNWPLALVRSISSGSSSSSKHANQKEGENDR